MLINYWCIFAEFHACDTRKKCFQTALSFDGGYDWGQSEISSTSCVDRVLRACKFHAVDRGTTFDIEMNMKKLTAKLQPLRRKARENKTNRYARVVFLCQRDKEIKCTGKQHRTLEMKETRIWRATDVKINAYIVSLRSSLVTICRIYMIDMKQQKSIFKFRDSCWEEFQNNFVCNTTRGVNSFVFLIEMLLGSHTNYNWQTRLSTQLKPNQTPRGTHWTMEQNIVFGCTQCITIVNSSMIIRNQRNEKD